MHSMRSRTVHCGIGFAAPLLSGSTSQCTRIILTTENITRPVIFKGFVVFVRITCEESLALRKVILFRRCAMINIDVFLVIAFSGMQIQFIPA